MTYATQADAEAHGWTFFESNSEANGYKAERSAFSSDRRPDTLFPHQESADSLEALLEMCFGYDSFHSSLGITI